MTPFHSGALRTSLRKAEIASGGAEGASKVTPTLHELHEQLRACQKRLGTPAETAGDMEHALSLAHAINNRLSGVLLMAEIRRPEKSSVLDWRRYLLYHRSVRS